MLFRMVEEVRGIEQMSELDVICFERVRGMGSLYNLNKKYR
jgi:hypothetical protein